VLKFLAEILSVLSVSVFAYFPSGNRKVRVMKTLEAGRQKLGTPREGVGRETATRSKGEIDDEERTTARRLRRDKGKKESDERRGRNANG